MPSGKTTFLSIAMPLCVVLVYVAFLEKPWFHPAPASAAEFSADDAGGLWEESKSLVRDGKYEQALPGVLRLHEKYPGNHIYLEMAAEIYNHLGRYKEETEYWEMYLDRAPDPSDACARLGAAYQEQGKEKEAISAQERCLERDPQNTDYIFFLAHSLERAGQTSRAGELYQRGLKISPDNSDLQTGYARVLIREGKREQAKGLILRRLEKAPDDVDALLVAGLILSGEGDLPKAKQYLTHGVQLSDGYLDFHRALADIAEREHDYPEAIRHYDRILKEHPDDQQLRAKRDALAGKQ
ncbi:MAG TPA: tetratricopeptide repeat protein [Candidatus Angelobacter sp.]|nr:tetratricopeptide repeat protein [Candidatus Angelobacter sp.]